MPSKSRQPTPKSKASITPETSTTSKSSKPNNTFLPIQSQPVSRHHEYEPYLREIPQATLSGQVINVYFPYMPSGEYPCEPAHFTEAYSHGCQLFAGSAMSQCLAAHGL